LILRLLQGISAVGEQAGAEFDDSSSTRRRIAAVLHELHAVRHAGGADLATLCFIPISALPEEDLLGLGFGRIPFLPQRDLRRGRLLGSGARCRRTPPSPRKEQKHVTPKLPVVSSSAITAAPCCAWSSRRCLGRQHDSSACFTLSYCGQHDAHPARHDAGRAGAGQPCFALFAIPRGPRYRTRIGRRPVFISGGRTGSAALIWPYMWALWTSKHRVIFFFGLLCRGWVLQRLRTALPSSMRDVQRRALRLSGMAIGTQIRLPLAVRATISAAVLAPARPAGCQCAVHRTGAAVVVRPARGVVGAWRPTTCRCMNSASTRRVASSYWLEVASHGNPAQDTRRRCGEAGIQTLAHPGDARGRGGAPTASPATISSSTWTRAARRSMTCHADQRRRARWASPG